MPCIKSSTVVGRGVSLEGLDSCDALMVPVREKSKVELLVPRYLSQGDLYHQL